MATNREKVNMNILSLDPAEKTGFRSPTTSGVFSVKLRSNESKGMKMIKFKSHIKEIILKDDIQLVVYEKPGGRNFAAVRSHSNFEGIILNTCEEMGVEYRDYSAGEIKRYAKETYEQATGESIKKGNMNKGDMVEAAITLYDRTFIDDNHVDAYFLYELAQKELT